MAIQSSCGQSEKEEAVRLVVGRWGVVAGPRDGCDRHGWSPLHLAALLSSPQTVSVLLNRGASLSAVNDAGFTPFDLVTGMDGRENLALLLDPWAGGTPHTPSTPSSSDDAARIAPERRAQIQRRRIRVATRAERARRKDEEAGVAAERERWVRDRAKHIGVDPTVLFPPNQPQVDDDEEEEEDDDEVEDDDEMEVDEVLGGLASDVRAKVSASFVARADARWTWMRRFSSSPSTSCPCCSMCLSRRTGPCASRGRGAHCPPTRCSCTLASRTTAATRRGSRSCCGAPSRRSRG
jgi:hypothetical protein